MRQELDRRNSVFLQQGPAACGSLSSHGAQLRLHETPHTSNSVQCSQSRARAVETEGFTCHFLDYFAKRKVVRHQGFKSCTSSQCWLRDCFCETWKSQLTAGGGSYLWATRILGQPCLILLPPHLNWGFLLQHLLLLPVIPWQLLQQLSASSLCHAAVSSHSAPSWAMQVSARAACAVSSGSRAWLKVPPCPLCGKGISSWCQGLYFASYPQCQTTLGIDCFASIFSKLCFSCLKIPEWRLQLIILSATWHLWALKHTCHGLSHWLGRGEMRDQSLTLSKGKQQFRAAIQLFGRTGSDVLFFYDLAEH